MAPIIGCITERLNRIDSTNNYASKLLLTKRPAEGTVIVTGNQTGGRGQGTNKWESEPDKNLIISVILYPEFVEAAEQFEISKAISLGVADFLKLFTEEVSIKWPNDIYIGKGKVAGILMEYSISRGKITSCISGIGLNINQLKFYSDAPNPVSLSQRTGITYNLEECLKMLLENLDNRYRQLSGGETDKIDAEYEQMLFQRGIWALYTAKGMDFEGRIIGVDEHGLLMMETRQKSLLKFDYKEVIFKI